MVGVGRSLTLLKYQMWCLSFLGRTCFMRYGSVSHCGCLGPISSLFNIIINLKIIDLIYSYPIKQY